jgi:hypothetical protein
MASRILFGVTATLCAIVAIFFSRPTPITEEKTFVQGRNNTVLFLSNDDFGLANVMVATTYALLTEHSNLDIHYGTHRKFESPLANINKLAAPKALSKPVTTHIFQGANFDDSVQAKIKKYGYSPHKGGWWDLRGLLGMIKFALQPFSPEDYLSLFKQCVELIEEVDPAIVVVENQFMAGIEAVRHLKRREINISPSALADSIGQFQPNGEVLWKYPACV